MEAGWYPDPTGRYEQRLWNGTRWTAQVHASGRVTSDPFERPPETVVADEPEPERPSRPAGEFLAGMREVRVRQRVEVGRNDYDYLDAEGSLVGTARQVRQSTVARAVRAVSKTFTTMGRHEYDVRDAGGRHVLTLIRPATWGGAPMHVLRPDRRVIGRIGPGVRGAHLALRVRGEVVATVRTTGIVLMVDWEISDECGVVVARLRKVHRGVVTEVLTRADSYALTLERPLDEPLRTLVLVTPLALDELLFQWAH